jgi:hypothetical protein
MRYRKLKSANAYCRRSKRCVRYDASDRKSIYLKYGEYAIDRTSAGRGFICKDCAPNYINEEYAALVKLSKDIIAEGDGEMTDTIIWSLGGDLENIIGEKK